MSGDFPDHFARLVVPQLEKMIKDHAWHLANYDHAEWSDAHMAIWARASKLGASSLPHAIYYDLMDWIDRELLAEFMAEEAKLERMKLELRRRYKRDPLEYWRWVVDSCSSETDKKWSHAAAMAFCPEYRAWAKRQAGPSLAERRKMRGLV